MKKNNTAVAASTFVLAFDASKKMSEYWNDFQAFAKSHKDALAAAKAKRDEAVRAANAEFAKIKETETTAVKMAYAEFQRIQSEFQSGRATARAERAAAVEAKAAEKAAKQSDEQPTDNDAEVDGISTEGLTADEIALLKASAA